MIKASGGKSVSRSGTAAQHNSSSMGGMTHQSKSRLSQEQVQDDEDDSSDDDGLHEEPPDMRVQAEFLKNLPGVQASDSMGYRIEALRVYLEMQLGETALKAAY